MDYTKLQNMTQILQMSISPVVLISGIGLLLLSMTNRLGRTVDRARLLADEVRRSPGEGNEARTSQIRILYRRSRYLRLSISFAVLSIFSTTLIIVCLFAINIYTVRLHHIAIGLFGVSMAFLVLSLAVFIKDISVALKALKKEIRDYI